MTSGTLGLGVVIYLRDMFSAQARTASANMQTLSGSARRNSQIIGNAMTTAATRTNKAMGSLGAGLAVGYGISRITKTAMQFNAAMAEVETISDEATTNMGALRREVLQQAATFAKMPLDQAKGLYYILSSGFTDAAQASTVLSSASSLAMVGLTDVQTAADGLTSVLLSYNKTAGEAAHVSDLLFETVRYGKAEMKDVASSIGMVASAAAVAGVKLEEMLAMYATLTLGGLSPSQAAQYERQIIMGIARPTMIGEKTAKKYGLDLSVDHMKEVGGVIPFLNEAVERVGGGMNADGTVKRMKDFTRLFAGRQAYAGAAVLMQAQHRLATIHKGIQNPYTTDEFGNTVSNRMRAEIIMVRTLQFQWNRFKTAIATFGIAIGTAVEPLFAAFFRVLNGILQTVTKLITAVPILAQALMFAGVSTSLLLLVRGFRILLNTWGLLNAIPAVTRMAGGLFGLTGLKPGSISTVTGALIGLSGAFWLIQKAFKGNFMGVRTFVGHLFLLARAFGEAQKNTYGFEHTISSATAHGLNKAGLFDTFTTLIAMFDRVKMFMYGFNLGFKQALRGIGESLRSFGRGLVGFVSIFDQGLGEQLKVLFDALTFTPSSIMAMLDMGRAVGKLAAVLGSLWIAGKAFAILGNLRGVFSLGAGFAAGARGGPRGGGVARALGGMAGSGFVNLYQGLFMRRQVRGPGGRLAGRQRGLFPRLIDGVGLAAGAVSGLWTKLFQGNRGANGKFLPKSQVGIVTRWVADMRRAFNGATGGRGLMFYLFNQGPIRMPNGRMAAATRGLVFRIIDTLRSARAPIGNAIAGIGTMMSSLLAGNLVPLIAAFTRLRTVAVGAFSTMFARMGASVLGFMASPPGIALGVIAATLGAIGYAVSRQEVGTSKVPLSNGEGGGRMPGTAAARALLQNYRSKEDLAKGWEQYYAASPIDKEADPSVLRDQYQSATAESDRLYKWAATLNGSPDKQARLKRAALEYARIGASIEGIAKARNFKLVAEDAPGANELDRHELDYDKFADDTEKATRQGTRDGIRDAANSGSFMFDVGTEQKPVSNPYQGYLDALTGAKAAMVAAGRGSAGNDLEAFGNFLGGQLGAAIAEWATRPVVLQLDGEVLGRSSDRRAATKHERGAFAAAQ